MPSVAEAWRGFIYISSSVDLNHPPPQRTYCYRLKQLPFIPFSSREYKGGAGTLSSEPEKGVLLPGLEASQTALWELLDFEGEILGSFCSTWTSRESQEDIMGCCSGRCTLAFICGMQLVSVYVTIDPVRGRKSGLNL